MKSNLQPPLTIMPGQSVEFTIEIPAEMVPGETLRGEFVPVPPPSQAPVQTKAQELGLCQGLRVDSTDSGFSCNACDRMQPAGIQVWVPDLVQEGDSAEAVTEECRKAAYNGEWSGWCLKCAKKLGQAEPGEIEEMHDWVDTVHAARGETTPPAKKRAKRIKWSERVPVGFWRSLRNKLGF